MTSRTEEEGPPNKQRGPTNQGKSSPQFFFHLLAALLQTWHLAGFLGGELEQGSGARHGVEVKGKKLEIKF